MPSVAAVIEKYASEILDSWMTEARRAAASRGLSEPELRNIMPSFLTALAQPGHEAAARRREATISHLGTRVRQGYTLPEIVEEFRVLGDCIARVCVGCALEERPDALDIARMFGELGDATTRLTEAFTEHLVKDAQTEKLYLRLLAQIASEALEGDSPHLRERLTEVVELILRSLGADTAALLLYAPETGDLVTQASAGMAAERLRDYAASLETSSLTGLIASSTEPTAIPNVATTELEISDALRESGVHSLLGVRLKVGDHLFGVLYVGLAERRAFTGREIHRLETLGEALTVHLDHAALYAELRRTIGALRVERGLRERFVSVLAHDLRGPLSVARMSAELLLGHPEKVEERPALAAKIVRSIDRADRMIRDLLDVTRIRAGKRLPLRLGRCSLDGIAREVVEEMNVLHGDRVVARAPEKPILGIWSADELRRTLWNLVSNALKYGAPDRPVTVSVTRTDAGARLSVHNEGSYIAEEDRSRLFAPFARSAATQARGPRGWGLGLTLVQGCAEAHGGRVEIESDRERGTTFAVELPLDARPFQGREDDDQEAPPDGPSIH